MSTTRFVTYSDACEGETFEVFGWTLSAVVSCVVFDESTVSAGPGCTMIEGERYEIEDLSIRSVQVHNERGDSLALGNLPADIFAALRAQVGRSIINQASKETDWKEVESE